MKFLLGALATIFGIAGIGIAVFAKLTYPTLSGWAPHAYIAAGFSPFIIGSAFAISRSKQLSLMNSFSRPFVFSWLGAVGMFAGGIEFANGKFDSSTGIPHTVTVQQKKISHGKRSESYSIIVSSWREGHTSEKLDVTRKVFDALEEGSSQIEVISHQGALGMEWIEPFHG